MGSTLSHEGDTLASGSITASASAGVSGDAHANIGLNGGKLEFDVGVEATAGLGLGVEVKGSVNPGNMLKAVGETAAAAGGEILKNVAEGAINAGGAVADAAGDVFSSAVDGLGNVVHGVGDAAAKRWRFLRLVDRLALSLDRRSDGRLQAGNLRRALMKQGLLKEAAREFEQRSRSRIPPTPALCWGWRVCGSRRMTRPRRVPCCGGWSSCTPPTPRPSATWRGSRPRRATRARWSCWARWPPSPRPASSRCSTTAGRC